MKKEMEFQLDDKGSEKKVKNYKLMFFLFAKRLRHDSLTYFF